MSMYLVGFGTEGYEFMICLEDYKKNEDDLVKVLKGGELDKDKHLGSLLSSLSMRIRMNMHRMIECYTLGIDDSAVEIVREGLIENCDSVKNTVREIGKGIRI